MKYNVLWSLLEMCLIQFGVCPYCGSNANAYQQKQGD
jgi:hypothetical protein